MHEGKSMVFPLDVKWSGGDEAYVNLWVTIFDGFVTVMATSDDTRGYAGTDLDPSDGLFSMRLVHWMLAAIEDVSDFDERHWQTQTLAITRLGS